MIEKHKALMSSEIEQEYYLEGTRIDIDLKKRTLDCICGYMERNCKGHEKLIDYVVKHEFIEDKKLPKKIVYYSSDITKSNPNEVPMGSMRIWVYIYLENLQAEKVSNFSYGGMMEKANIEIIKHENHIMNYTKFDKGFNDEDVLNLIVEFTKTMDKDITIYRHLVKESFKPYEPSKYHKIRNARIPDADIPMGTQTFILVIYYQIV